MTSNGGTGVHIADEQPPGTSNGGLRANGHQPPIANGSGLSNLFRDIPAYTPRRKLKVVTVGAGFSGLLFAHKLQHQYPKMQDMVEHKILENRNELGGTCLVNTYPGIQCDVPAHIYAFPFDPNPDWSHFYASGKEIHDYLMQTTKKWNLDRDIQFGTRLQEARWQASEGQYKLTLLRDGREIVEYADVLVSGQGILKYTSTKVPRVSS